MLETFEKIAVVWVDMFGQKTFNLISQILFFFFWGNFQKHFQFFVLRVSGDVTADPPVWSSDVPVPLSRGGDERIAGNASREIDQEERLEMFE